MNKTHSILMLSLHGFIRKHTNMSLVQAHDVEKKCDIFQEYKSYFLYDNEYKYLKLKDASSSSASSSVPKNSHSSFCFSEFFPSRSWIFYSCVVDNIAAFLPSYQTDLPIKFLILLHLNLFKVKATDIPRFSPLPKIWIMPSLSS